MADKKNDAGENRPLRIAFVTGWMAPRGAVKYSHVLARGLIQRGHTVKVLSPGGPMQDLFRKSEMDLECHRGMSIPLLNVFSLRSAAWAVRHFKADLIHVQSREAASFGIKLARLVGLPSVLTIHTFDSARRLRLPKRSRILAVSQSLREALVNAAKAPKERLDVVPNGIDVSLYRPSPPFANPSQVPVVGSFGRLDPVKGFEYFIKAARIVLEAGRKVEFLIAGTGSDEYRLRNLVSSLGIAERVTFNCEEIDYARRIEFVDIVTTCSLREGFGMVVLESMAYGKPVISSAIGGIYDLIKDGETGLLVPPKDPDAIAERIISLLRNPGEAERIGGNARARVEEMFTMDVMAEKTEKVYRGLLEERVR